MFIFWHSVFSLVLLHTINIHWIFQWVKNSWIVGARTIQFYNQLQNEVNNQDDLPLCLFLLLYTGFSSVFSFFSKELDNTNPICLSDYELEKCWIMLQELFQVEYWYPIAFICRNVIYIVMSCITVVNVSIQFAMAIINK